MMAFNTAKFYDTELEPFFKDVPVPDLAYFFDPEPSIVARLAYAKKKQDLFLAKNFIDVDDLEVGVTQLNVAALEWALEEYGAQKDLQNELDKSREQLQLLFEASKKNKPNKINQPQKLNQDNLEQRKAKGLEFIQAEINELEKKADSSRTENAIFRVINPGAETIGKVQEQVADKIGNQMAAIIAAFQNKGEPISEKVDSFQKLFHINKDTSETFKKELGFMTQACFYPNGDKWEPLQLPMVLKIAENYPITFKTLFQEIMKAMGEGSIIKKPK